MCPLVIPTHSRLSAQHGLLRLLSYLLQTLSADQSFAGALGQTLRMTVPTKWAVPGSLADFLIVVRVVTQLGTSSHRAIVHLLYSHHTGLESSLPRSDHQYLECRPLSAKYRSPGVYSSAAVVQGIFGAEFPASGRESSEISLLPVSCFARSPHLSDTCWQARNIQLNIVSSTERYALEQSLEYLSLTGWLANPNLVYAILRSHQDFQALATFTLMSGLREIQRRKVLRATREYKVQKSLVMLTRDVRIHSQGR